MRRRWLTPLMVWAARDLVRQPGRTILLLAALFSMAVLVSLLLVLHQTIAAAAGQLAADAPALVVQRVDPHGWRPLPADTALARVAGVVGVVRPRVRIQGVVQGPLGPVTVIGATRDVLAHLPRGAPSPGAGQALVGPAVLPGAGPLTLRPPGQPAMRFAVVHRFSAGRGLAAAEVAVLHAADARTLLGLAADQASDLVLDVFHDEEAEALIPDLARALAWPVRITSRQDRLGQTLSSLSRRAGMLLAAFVPALLAMALLVAALGAWGRQRQWEMGLFKAVGWRSADLLQLYLYRGVLVGAPALLGGAACAGLLLFLPGMAWISRLLYDWGGPPPVLFFTFGRGCAGLLLGTLVVGVPFLAVIFWTGWQAATADPADGLTEGGG